MIILYPQLPLLIVYFHWVFHNVRFKPKSVFPTFSRYSKFIALISRLYEMMMWSKFDEMGFTNSIRWVLLGFTQFYWELLIFFITSICSNPLSYKLWIPITETFYSCDYLKTWSLPFPKINYKPQIGFTKIWWYDNLHVLTLALRIVRKKN